MSESNTQNSQYSEPSWFYRLQLNAPDPEAPTENAQMMIGLDGDTPVVQVWPRGESQKGKGPIRARMNTTAFGLHLPEMMYAIANGNPGDKGVLPVLGNRKDGDAYVQKHVSSFMCGKRQDGVVVFALFDEDSSRPRILFPFTQFDWVKSPEINGEPMDVAALSVATCRWYADFFKRMCTDNALKQTAAERKAFQDMVRARREERSNNFRGSNRQGNGGNGQGNADLLL